MAQDTLKRKTIMTLRSFKAVAGLRLGTSVPLAIVLMALANCGDKASAPTIAEAESEDTSSYPCLLLTKQQAASVVPENDGGYVAHAGGSLIKGVDSYQCSYSNPSGALLTVIWHDAVDAARFAQIEPGHSLINDAKKVEVAERGWMLVRENSVKVTAVQQRTTIEVELMSPTARDKSEAVLALTKTVALKLAARS
jgi:hypothetical protein